MLKDEEGRTNVRPSILLSYDGSSAFSTLTSPFSFWCRNGSGRVPLRNHSSLRYRRFRHALVSRLKNHVLTPSGLMLWHSEHHKTRCNFVCSSCLLSSLMTGGIWQVDPSTWVDGWFLRTSSFFNLVFDNYQIVQSLDHFQFLVTAQFILIWEKRQRVTITKRDCDGHEEMAII